MKFEALRTITVHVLVKFLSVQSVNALASCNRNFRSLLRTEFVWATLHARDHPVIGPEKLMDAIRTQLLQIYVLVVSAEPKIKRALTDDERLRLLKTAFERLLAVQSALLETDYWQEIAWKHDDDWPTQLLSSLWGFRTAFSPDAKEALAAVPSLSSEVQAEAAIKPDCVVIERHPRPRAKTSKRRHRCLPGSADDYEQIPDAPQTTSQSGDCKLEGIQITIRPEIAANPAQLGISLFRNLLRLATVREALEYSRTACLQDAESQQLLTRNIAAAVEQFWDPEQLFDLVQYELSRLNLGMDKLVRPFWFRDSTDTPQPADADRSSVAVISGPMAPSKAQYISRARFRAFQRTSTSEQQAHINKALRPLTIIALYVWLTLWLVIGYFAFDPPQTADGDTAFAAFRTGLTMLVAAVFFLFVLALYLSVAALWRFYSNHTAKYGGHDDDTQLLPSSKRWQYALFLVNGHRPTTEDEMQWGYTLLTMLIIPFMIAIVIAIVKLHSASSDGSGDGSGLSSSAIAGIAFGALFTLLTALPAIAGAIVGFAFALSGNRDSAMIFYLCSAAIVEIVLIWLAAFGKVSAVPILTLFACSWILAFGVAALRPSTKDWIMLQLRKPSVRREFFPAFVVSVLAIVRLEIPSSGVTWTAVFAPFWIQALCHLCYTCFLLAKHGLGLGWAPMITFVSLANTPTLGSQPEGVELTTDKRSVALREKAVRLMNDLRRDRLFHAGVQLIRRHVVNLEPFHQS